MQATPRRLIASTSRLLQRISPSSSSSSSSTSPASSSSSGGSERTRPLDPSKLLHAISRTQTGKQKRRDRARAVFSAEQDGQNKNNEASQSDLSTGLFAREDPAIYLESIRRGSKSTSTSTDTGASGVTGVDGDLDSPPSSSSSYFNLGEYHSMLDIHPGLYSTSEDGLTKTVHINAPQAPMFPELSSSQMQAIKANSEAGNAAEGDSLAALAADATNAFTVPQLRNLHRYPLVVRRVVNMTSKGKQPSMYALVVVGDGNGLVGFGEGKSENIIKANDRAFVQAVKNMDYVQRKDSRTTWADLMSGKWGATTVELRSRPPGERLPSLSLPLPLFPRQERLTVSALST